MTQYDLKQAIKFAIVGVANTAIDFALFFLLYFFLNVSIIFANTVGYCAGVANSFFCNKYWTFADSKDTCRVAEQFPLFFSLYLVGLVLSNLTVWWLAFILPELLAKACAVSVTFVWNFWSTRRFVYKAHEWPRRSGVETVC